MEYIIIRYKFYISRREDLKKNCIFMTFGKKVGVQRPKPIFRIKLEFGQVHRGG